MLPPITYALSIALAIVAVLASGGSFFFWNAFSREAPMTVGNLRGTALAMLIIAVPLLIGSMRLAARGSLRARFVWLGTVAYIAYNAVMFCFALQFNPFLLLFIALLSLSFWSLVVLLSHFDPAAVKAAAARVPARAVSGYMLVCLLIFALTWLRDIIPATISHTLPDSFEGTGLTQNPIYVLDFAFTFPLMAIGAVWIWRQHGWGYVISGMMVIMLTIETAGIAIDQVFGHLHDPSAPLDAVPIMLAFTAAGLAFSTGFLRGVEARSRPEVSPSPRAGDSGDAAQRWSA
jgi:hypothetical protein